MVDKFVVSAHYRISFLHLIKSGIKVNCYFLQNRAGVPLKSCACGIARTKVIAVFFFSLLSYIPTFRVAVKT